MWHWEMPFWKCLVLNKIAIPSCRKDMGKYLISLVQVLCARGPKLIGPGSSQRRLTALSGHSWQMIASHHEWSHQLSLYVTLLFSFDSGLKVTKCNWDRDRNLLDAFIHHVMHSSLRIDKFLSLPLSFSSLSSCGTSFTSAVQPIGLLCFAF